MSARADIHSLHALQELDTALARFGARALAVLDAIEPEIRRRLEILEERHQYWLHEVQYWQSVYEEAGDEEERSEAAYKLKEAKEELHNVRHYQKRVEECYRDYHRHAERLRDLCTRHTAKTRAFLQKKLAELGAYVAEDMSGISDSAATGTSPIAKVTEAAISDSSGPIITGFEKSSEMNNEDVQHYVEERIPLPHLNELTRIVYADTYKTDDSQYIVGHIVLNPLTGKYDTVIIYRQPPDVDDLRREIKVTIAHEIGHNVYFNVLDGATRAEWECLSASSRGYVTNYAKRNVEEDFAESYAIYIVDPELLRGLNPDKYAFLRDRVFNGREYL